MVELRSKGKPTVESLTTLFGTSQWRCVLIVLLLASVPIYILGYALIPRTGDFGLSLFAYPPATNSNGTRIPVTDVAPGSPAERAGIRSGDTIIVSGNNGAQILWPLPGDRIVARYERAKQIRTASLVATNAQPYQLSLPEYIRAGVVAFLLIFALLVAVRAWNTEYGPLIATFLTAAVLFAASDADPVFARSGIGAVAVGANQLINTAGTVGTFAVFLLVNRLLAGRSPGVRFIAIFSGINAAVIIAFDPFITAATFSGRAGLFLGGLLLWCTVVVPIVTPVLGLPYAYAVSRGEARARFAWLFWGYYPYSVGVLINYLPLLVPQSLPLYANDRVVLSIGIVWSLLELSLPVGLFYGLLLRRTIDMGFLVNRATVYGLVSVAVLFILSTLEFLIGHYFVELGRVASLALQLGVALIVAFSIRYLHRIIDRFVDLVFFAKRHSDETALRRFAHEAEAFTSEKTLLDRTMEMIRDHSEARGVAIYLSNREVAKVERTSSEAFPAVVDLDDPALVALRRWNEPLDTHAVHSVLPDGMAFPMVARGRLYGVLACLPKRDATAFAPDEREPLMEVATGLAHALALASNRSDPLNKIDRSIEALRVTMQQGFEGTLSAIEHAVTAMKDGVVEDGAPPD
jgi:hypothetical protein